MENMTYEEAFARLTRITETLEDTTLPLSELSKLYKEGRELISFCREMLDTTEKELTVLEEADNEG